jgi:eukaryotic-like serine/threonine-protein kinase
MRADRPSQCPKGSQGVDMAHVAHEEDAQNSPLRKIDLLAARFERQWRPANPPRIADYLDEADPELRLGLLVELVCMDMEHRGRHNLPATLDDYFHEFPELESLSATDRADLISHFPEHCHDPARTKTCVSPTNGTAPEVPLMIGRFPIAGRLGSGGQADVFLSFHPDLSVPVVVKWHRTQGTCDTTNREHLIREGRILAGLEAHPNLLRVYELGFHEGRPFLVLEHVQGQTLDHYTDGERLTPRRAAELVAALAEAAHSAHRQGIVHQDINPRNVLIDGRGQPRLIDFGLAWLRSPWIDSLAEVCPEGGTPRYLAPEKADPKVGPVGPRTDVFGLGAVLYFLLSGRSLYDGATVPEIVRQAAQATYDAAVLEQAGVPKRLAAVCRKALSRDPEARFETAADLAAALRAAARQPPWPRVAVLAVLFLAAGAAGWLLGQPRSPGPGTSPPGSGRAMDIRVWRPKTHYTPLSEALPVHTGDQLQVRFRVPPGLHVGLSAINGHGRLTLLQRYPPQKTETELVYPGPDQTSDLMPPEGTETLLVCGRARVAVSEAELQAMWDGAAPWPALEPPDRLLRLQRDHVREEGERSRDYGATHDRPGSDAVTRRLDGLRERLRPKYAFFEGLAFAHE